MNVLDQILLYLLACIVVSDLAKRADMPVFSRLTKYAAALLCGVAVFLFWR